MAELTAKIAPLGENYTGNFPRKIYQRNLLPAPYFHTISDEIRGNHNHARGECKKRDARIFPRVIGEFDDAQLRTNQA
jgi:hypothetical protein